MDWGAIVTPTEALHAAAYAAERLVIFVAQSCGAFRPTVE
jgi:hypothetical protein